MTPASNITIASDVGYDQPPNISIILSFAPKNGAGDAIRTRDIFLGKEVLYH